MLSSPVSQADSFFLTTFVISYDPDTTDGAIQRRRRQKSLLLSINCRFWGSFDHIASGVERIRR